jgi:hypothetical protein
MSDAIRSGVYWQKPDKLVGPATGIRKIISA